MHQLIASEPLTFEKADWLEIPCQTCVIVTPRMNVLQIPIIDEFYQSSVHPVRNPDFASAKGYEFARPSVKDKAGSLPKQALAEVVV